MTEIPLEKHDAQPPDRNILFLLIKGRNGRGKFLSLVVVAIVPGFCMGESWKMFDIYSDWNVLLDFTGMGGRLLLICSIGLRGNVVWLILYS